MADDQVDVELPAGRLGDDEDRLVAQKRAAKEVRPFTGCAWKIAVWIWWWWRGGGAERRAPGSGRVGACNHQS